ncbi:MAG: DUF2341 domain-containing protein [Bacteroidota bacterium]
MTTFQRLTLSIVTLIFFSNLHAQTCMPCSYDQDWLHAKSIQIDNSTNAQALTGHQIKITFDSQALIAANEMNADGSDLRFTSDCSDNLSYWIEDGLNTPTTNVWVKLSSVAANALDTIHLFYGNSAAVAQSSADNTFEFFDDFEGATLDLAKWEVRGTPGIMNLSGGILSFSGNNNWEYIRSNIHFTQRVVIEETHSKSGPSFGLLLGYSGSDFRYTFRTAGPDLGCTEDPDVSGGNAWFNMGYPALPASADAATFYDYKIVAGMNGSNIELSEYCNTTTANCNNTTVSLTSASGSDFFIGYSSYAVGYDGFSKNIRVRKYTPVEPTMTYLNAYNAVVVDLGADTMLCENLSLTLDAGNSGSTFTWDDGSVSQTISPTTSGSYWVEVLSPSGCTKRDTISVTFNSLPVVDLGIDTSLCEGSTLMLDAQNTGSSYDWSSGETTQQISLMTAGFYSVSVTDGNMCSSADTIIVQVSPLPIVNLGSDISICNGTSAQLDAQNNGSSFLWSDGSLTQTINVSSTGAYSVAVTNGTGCITADTVVVTVLSVPVVDLGNDATFCAGNMLVLDAQNAGDTYEWSTGDTLQQISVNASGSYSVEVIQANGCSASDTIIVSEVTIDNTTSVAGITITANESNATYQWIDCSNGQAIQGATNAGFTPVSNGSYAVALTSNSCNDTSDCVTISTIGLSETGMELALIYPNPTSGLVTIVSPNSGKYVITDIAGKVLKVVELEKSVESTIDLGSLANGVYWLRSGENNLLNQRIVLTR